MPVSSRLIKKVLPTRYMVSPCLPFVLRTVRTHAKKRPLLMIEHSNESAWGPENLSLFDKMEGMRNEYLRR